MRLIDADELLKPVGCYNPIKYTYEYGEVVKVEDITQMPTVDAEPIKHGHWTRTEAYPHRVVCSECYGTYVRNENIIEGRYKGDEIVPIYCTEAEYCPRCGAKMDEVEE